MQSSIVLLSAFLAAAMASPQAGGSVALGAICTSSSQCPAGVDCYAVNSMEATRCGNQGSTCTSDLQCAFNTCVSGFCNGLLSSSSAVISSATATTSSDSSSATAVALGAACTTSSQCPVGVSCYAVNSMLVTRCGNEGANCNSNSQCAFNTCVSGSCVGVLSSSSSKTGSTITSSIKSSTAAVPTTSSFSSRSNTTITTTGVPAGFTTSVTVSNGVTSSVLINSNGATTSFGSVATSVITSVPTNGASSLAIGFGGIIAIAGGFAMIL